MNKKVCEVLLQQRKSIDDSPEAMQISKVVFLGPAGGQRKLNNYFWQFRRIRNYIGISKDCWLNHCLGEIVVWTLMSSQKDTAVA